MWGHELQAGTTVYFDSAKKFSAATTAFFEMHSNKEDQDLKVGNLLTLEGGVAYNVPKIAGAFGVAYYFQGKVSDDSGADVAVAALQALNLYGKNRLFGIGPDVAMSITPTASASSTTASRRWDASKLRSPRPTNAAGQSSA